MNQSKERKAAQVLHQGAKVLFDFEKNDDYEKNAFRARPVGDETYEWKDGRWVHLDEANLHIPELSRSRLNWATHYYGPGKVEAIDATDCAEVSFRLGKYNRFAVKVPRQDLQVVATPSKHFGKLHKGAHVLFDFKKNYAFHARPFGEDPPMPPQKPKISSSRLNWATQYYGHGKVEAIDETADYAEVSFPFGSGTRYVVMVPTQDLQVVATPSKHFAKLYKGAEVLFDFKKEYDYQRNAFYARPFGEDPPTSPQKPQISRSRLNWATQYYGSGKVEAIDENSDYADVSFPFGSGTRYVVMVPTEDLLLIRTFYDRARVATDERSNGKMRTARLRYF